MTKSQPSPSPEELMARGLDARARGRNAEAAAHYRAAIAACDDYPEAYFNLGVVAEAMGERANAEAAYRAALARRPGYLKALVNLAVLLTDGGRYEAAAAVFEDALAADPASPEALNGRGNLRRAMGEFAAAAADYRAATEAREGFWVARWNLAFVELAMGDFEAGWANYRFRPGADRVAFPMPEGRLPGDLSGRRIPLAAEQGLGDELFFLRFAAALKARGARVAYRPEPKLASLCHRIAEVDEVLDAGDGVEFTIADLPYLLGAADCPSSVAIAARPSSLAAVGVRLAAAGPGPYLGLTWRAGMPDGYTLFKEAPVTALGAAAKNWPGTVINIQREPADSEGAALDSALGRPAADFSALNHDLEAMLALMHLLDDYAGVSNTNMHLRAAAGRPARVLVTHPAEYRWLAEGDASPWFPGFTLYRQGRDGDWHLPLDRLAVELSA